jgi:uncharacterized protein YkwD
MNRRRFFLVLAGTLRANEEENLFAAGNRERNRRGIAELSWSDAVALEARRHSERMAGEGFFSHRDPEHGDLGKRLRAAGIRYRACAENLFRQSSSSKLASAAVKAWLGSRGHRTNLLNRMYRETGIGVAVDSQGHRLVTQIFLAQIISCETTKQTQPVVCLPVKEGSSTHRSGEDE